MQSEIYKKLQEQLDQYSCGFPTTESGVELKILEKLFTEEEAQIFLHMNLKPEAPDKVAKRIGHDPNAVASILHKMGEKGIVFPLRKGETVNYGAMPFMLGIYELQLGRMDKEMAGMYEKYFGEAFLASTTTVDPLMRSIPVNRSVNVSHHIATYDDSREIVKSKDFIVLAKCICRVHQGLIEESCDKPVEVCLNFGSWGQQFIDMGMGRQITVEEALKILDQSEKAGLVTQHSNYQNPGGICNCCGDCCAILRGLNKLNRPSEVIISNYFSVVNPELCDGCETCLERCQMGAITINEEDVADINLDRCIGCGLCVTACPSEALNLEIKPGDQLRNPPETAREGMAMMAEKRGKSLNLLTSK